MQALQAASTCALVPRARCARRGAPQRVAAHAGKRSEQAVPAALSRREAALAGVAAVLSGSLFAGEAHAFLGFGGKSDDEVYAEDTKAIIDQMRATLALPKDDPAQVESIARMRQLTNSWVAKYRRNGAVTGRASYGNTYSALNAVAGHYNNFGTKYPLPAKRAERALKELSDAELLLERGR